MACQRCGGLTESAIVSLFVAGDEPAVIQNIPASVCRACGDRSYAGEVTAAIIELKKSRPDGYIKVPVFRFPLVATLTNGKTVR